MAAKPKRALVCIYERGKDDYWIHLRMPLSMFDGFVKGYTEVGKNAR